jgi:hypothetical protein
MARAQTRQTANKEEAEERTNQRTEPTGKTRPARAKSFTLSASSTIAGGLASAPLQIGYAPIAHSCAKATAVKKMGRTEMQTLVDLFEINGVTAETMRPLAFERAKARAPQLSIDLEVEWEADSVPVRDSAPHSPKVVAPSSPHGVPAETWRRARSWMSEF